VDRSRTARWCAREGMLRLIPGTGDGLASGGFRQSSWVILVELGGGSRESFNT